MPLTRQGMLDETIGFGLSAWDINLFISCSQMFSGISCWKTKQVLQFNEFILDLDGIHFNTVGIGLPFTFGQVDFFDSKIC